MPIEPITNVALLKRFTEIDKALLARDDTRWRVSQNLLHPLFKTHQKPERRIGFNPYKD